MHRFLLIVIILSIVPSYGYCKSSSHTPKEPIKSRLNEIRKHIKEKREEIKISKQKAEAILDEIDKIDRQNSEIGSKIDKLNTEKTDLMNEIAETQKKISSIDSVSYTHLTLPISARHINE